MIDIFVYLFENYYNFDVHPKSPSLARKLTAAGFEGNEVSQALDWLDGVKAAHLPEITCDPRSVRIYTAQEQHQLGVECLNFIAFLESARVLSPALRELVIERGLLLADESLAVDKLKIIVLMVLWRCKQNLEPLIVEELLYGADPDLPH